MIDETAVFAAFEAAWQQRHYAEVDRLLCDPALSRDTAAELVMIDLEYRWRFPLPAPDCDRAVVPNEPQVEDYCRLLPGLADHQELSKDLLSEEYRVRLRWSEPPTLEDLARRFGCLSRQVIEGLVQRVQQEVPHRWISVVRGETELVRTRFHRSLEVGRQSVGQPPPFGEVHVAEGRKLIIAALDNVQVSRKQLRLSCAAAGVQLENLSSQVAVKVGFRSWVRPGQTLENALPLTVAIGDLELRITR
ncbi:hypothetical protein EC9_06670 [Rosistilla ulvae]|uniref:Uncharacterized protein n=1 Tax=Rosistilla ulvae TaxID=1930277 RepID=A0A517LV49_9BACT|nr:hypothetical protein [Rosistilla ulvae]QDS86503.1 hypothetical protein EC9_06670 [Rosistilla ulvae]